MLTTIVNFMQEQGLGMLVGVTIGITVNILWHFMQPACEEVRKALFLNNERKAELLKAKEDHAKQLKLEFDENTELDEDGNYMIDLLLRDAAKKLRNTNETHSKTFSPTAPVYLTKVDSEGIEVCIGTVGIKWIKQIDNEWYYADKDSPNSIRVETIWRIDYDKIVSINWKSNDYWNWPWISCRVTRKSRSLYSREFFAQETKLRKREYFIEKCEVQNVKPILKV